MIEVHPHPAPDRHGGARVRAGRGRAAAPRRARRRLSARWSRRCELGLFGASCRAYGGLGLDVTTYARAIEEICRGSCRSPASSTATMAALIVLHHGTDEQRARLLPRFARGEAPAASAHRAPRGSDVQALRGGAAGQRPLPHLRLRCSSRPARGNTFILALTDPPPRRAPQHVLLHRGGAARARGREVHRQAHKGVDPRSCSSTPSLPGGESDRRSGGPRVQARDVGPRTGRINIAARAVGVASRHSSTRRAAARAGPRRRRPCSAIWRPREQPSLVPCLGGQRQDRRERCDLEAGIAKLRLGGGTGGGRRRHAHRGAGQPARGPRVRGSIATRRSRSSGRHQRDQRLISTRACSTATASASAR